MQALHLIARTEDVAKSQWDGNFHRQKQQGTVVYRGAVYDHIQYSNRGQGSAHISGKNKWGLKFAKGHDLPFLDHEGKPFAECNGLALNPGQSTPYLPVHRGIAGLDAKRVACAIEGTRFPPQLPAEGECCPVDSALLRAADFIGQLGDPNYIRKANALYYEFEEAGLNRQLGYSSPADIVNLYPQFYWNSVSPHIQTAIRYLNVTADGRQWIANLYSNVFRAEREIRLSGPQK
mgnify:CR=1 FL=1